MFLNKSTSKLVLSVTAELQFTQLRLQEIAMFLNIHSAFPLAFLPDSIPSTLVPSGDAFIFLLMKGEAGRWAQSQCPAFRQRNLGVRVQQPYTTKGVTQVLEKPVSTISPFKPSFAPSFLLCMGKRGNWGQQKQKACRRGSLYAGGYTDPQMGLLEKKPRSEVCSVAKPNPHLLFCL